MRNKQIFLISFIIYLCTISSVRAGEYHLLPEPQKFTPLGSSFVGQNKAFYSGASARVGSFCC